MENLAACYKQLNSSVGEFATATLEADTAAIQSDSPGDATYSARSLSRLSSLEQARDGLADAIKVQLNAAAFWHLPVLGARFETARCRDLIARAEALDG